jgi:hypothetical protein
LVNRNPTFLSENLVVGVPVCVEFFTVPFEVAEDKESFVVCEGPSIYYFFHFFHYAFFHRVLEVLDRLHPLKAWLFRRNIKGVILIVLIVPGVPPIPIFSFNFFFFLLWFFVF